MKHEIKDSADYKAAKINKFMEEFSALLDKHRTEIIRSADDGSLVVCTHLTGYDFIEFTFKEDISGEKIDFEYFKADRF